MRYLITGATSRTHLVHLAAYLRERPGADVSVSMPARFLGRARVTQQDVRTFLPEDLQLRFPSSPAQWPTGDLTYLSVGAPGIKPWIRLRRSQIRRNLQVVVTDEGIGTYGDWETRRAALRRQGVSDRTAFARAVAISGASRVLTSQRWALYYFDGGWKIQQQIAEEFQRHTARPTRRSQDLVLLTQPWVTLGLLTAEHYRAHVRAIGAYAERQGLRAVVRPHPAEDPAFYEGFTVHDPPIPAELDSFVVQAAGVIGATSTALLNLRAVFGVPATRVVAPGLEQLEWDLGETQRSLLDHYLPRAARVSPDGRLESFM